MISDRSAATYSTLDAYSRWDPIRDSSRPARLLWLAWSIFRIQPPFDQLLLVLPLYPSRRKRFYSTSARQRHKCSQRQANMNHSPSLSSMCSARIHHGDRQSLLSAEWGFRQRFRPARERSSRCEDPASNPPHSPLIKSFLDSSLSTDFNPNRQTWHLFKSQALRLLFTLGLIALFILTLILFEKAGNVSHSRKEWFNAVTTILNLALGLNFLEVFKDMAKVLRWRVLASRPSTMREADLILGGESLMKLWDLMRESRKKPITFLACLLWILLNLLAQATIAMLSLNYSMDLGVGSKGAYTVAGIISAPRLDCFYN